MALQNYETVAQRLERFWTDHPSGRVFTDLIQSGAGYWIFRAQIFKKADDDYPVSVGHAHEVIGASQINKTSALEVCETSAVGRALALAGYHGSQIASLDEVVRAKARANEAPVIAAPAPGEAFDDHLIAFCYAGHGLNVELIDTDARRAELESPR